MSIFRKFIHSFSNKEYRILGMWNREYCKIKINNKVDLTNEDYCGLCSSYRTMKMKEKKKNKRSMVMNNNDEEEYIRFMM